MKINEKIFNFRVSKGITQDYLSYELGITQQAYSKLERGYSKITFEQVEKICEVFGITMSFLIDHNNLQKNNKLYMENGEILEKWSPIVKKITDIEWKQEFLSYFAEKYQISKKDDEEQLLPLCLLIISKIECNKEQLILVDDLIDIKTENISAKFDIDTSVMKASESIDIIKKLENIISKNSIEFLNNEIIKHNKIIINYNFLNSLSLISEADFKPKLIIKLNYSL